MNGHSSPTLLSTAVTFTATAVVRSRVQGVQMRSRSSLGSRVLRTSLTAFGLLATSDMSTARDFTDLIAWQRADDLERFVLEIIKRPSLARDSDYCQQAASAAASAPRNIAEGFGRFAPIQFANFLRIAIGSELETKNQILKA